MTDEQKLSKALQDFKTKYPGATSGDLQTFIIGWQEAVKNCFIPDVSNFANPQNPQMREGVSYGINEILTKFENGVELYQTNAVFATCVESLLRGGDVYKMLESVIVMHSEQQKRYKELIENGILRSEIVVTKERFD